LEAWADQHRRIISLIGYTLSFVLLFGGMALAAYHGGLAYYFGSLCGPTCLAIPVSEYVIAAMCGGAAILAAKLYARFVTSIGQTVAKLHDYAFNFIGLGFFLILGAFEKQHGGTQTRVLLEFMFGWWGAIFVVQFFRSEQSSDD
jgi:hypothetical protein